MHPSLLTPWSFEPLQIVPTVMVAALYLRRCRTLAEPNASDYWKDCSRNRSGAYDRNDIQPGFDFARWMCSASKGACPMPDAPIDDYTSHGLCEMNLPPADTTWRGMTHHSQFRCVEAVAPNAVEEAYQVPLASFYDKTLAPTGTLQMNDCAAAGTKQAAASAPSAAARTFVMDRTLYARSHAVNQDSLIAAPRIARAITSFWISLVPS